MTPKQYLAQHELTAHLMHLGVTRRQLDGVEYRILPGEPFHDWLVFSRYPWPDDLLPERDVWCALRWLILTDPPYSREKEAAWHYVGLYLKRMHEVKSRNARVVKAAQIKSNNNRKSKADHEALAAFREWEKAVAAVLPGLGAPERLRRYFKVKQPSDRQRRRLRGLLKSGMI
jgi:hypothetical protein